MLLKSSERRLRLQIVLAMLLQASLRLLKRSSRSGIEMFLVTLRLKSMIFWVLSTLWMRKKNHVAFNTDESSKEKLLTRIAPKLL